jgi:hypothetical protein
VRRGEVGWRRQLLRSSGAAREQGEGGDGAPELVPAGATPELVPAGAAPELVPANNLVRAPPRRPEWQPPVRRAWRRGCPLTHSPNARGAWMGIGNPPRRWVTARRERADLAMRARGGRGRLGDANRAGRPLAPSCVGGGVLATVSGCARAIAIAGTSGDVDRDFVVDSAAE